MHFHEVFLAENATNVEAQTFPDANRAIYVEDLSKEFPMFALTFGFLASVCTPSSLFTLLFVSWTGYAR